MHISFVILHYLTEKDTIECVESIKDNISYPDFSIIIIDNGSPNCSGEILENKYKNINNISVLKSTENLGFAKGNNIGYEFAKKNKNADFIIMVNNDTLIKQRDFCEKMISEYKKTNFDVAGPDIISLIDGGHQNPVYCNEISIYYVTARIKKLKLLLFFSYLYLDNYIQKLKCAIKKEGENLNFKEYQLHGSCLIFSPNYIKNYDGLYSETFMYCEEEILKYISIRDNLKMEYLPSIRIYHKEDSSTNAQYKKGIEKRRFYYKNAINSYKKLQCLMKDKSYIG